MKPEDRKLYSDAMNSARRSKNSISEKDAVETHEKPKMKQTQFEHPKIKGLNIQKFEQA